jgi:hypothetical protein
MDAAPGQCGELAIDLRGVDVFGQFDKGHGGGGDIRTAPLIEVNLMAKERGVDRGEGDEVGVDKVGVLFPVFDDTRYR